MANWQDVGIENYRDALILQDNNAYRSAISRCYYAVFSMLTFELDRRGARPDFANNRATPGHGQLALLIDKYFQQFTETRKTNLIHEVAVLYRSRIESDYQSKRIGRDAALDAFQSSERIARYLGVKI